MLFCKEFYQKKLNIAKLYFNHDIDPDHSCQFWICRDCIKIKRLSKINELCPNCGKFLITFSKINRIFRYYKWKTKKNN